MARTERKSYLTTLSWEHAKEIDVDLEEGKTVRYEVPDLHQYIALGTIPNPLSVMAARIDEGAVTLDKLSAKEKREYFDLQCWVIAKHLRRPNLVEEMGEEKAVAWVQTKMHPDHRMALWVRSVHMFSPEEVLKSLGDLIPFRNGGQSDELPVGVGANGDSAK